MCQPDARKVVPPTIFFHFALPNACQLHLCFATISRPKVSKGKRPEHGERAVRKENRVVVRSHSLRSETEMDAVEETSFLTQ